MKKTRRLVFSTTITLLLVVAVAGTSLTGCPRDPVTELATVATVDAVDLGLRRLTLTIKEADARKLHELTVQNVNHRLELQIDGVTVARPMVREALVGRELHITWADDRTGNSIFHRIDARTQVPLTVVLAE